MCDSMLIKLSTLGAKIILRQTTTQMKKIKKKSPSHKFTRTHTRSHSHDECVFKCMHITIFPFLLLLLFRFLFFFVLFLCLFAPCVASLTFKLKVWPKNEITDSSKGTREIDGTVLGKDTARLKYDARNTDERRRKLRRFPRRRVCVREWGSFGNRSFSMGLVIECVHENLRRVKICWIDKKMGGVMKVWRSVFGLFSTVCSTLNFNYYIDFEEFAY